MCYRLSFQLVHSRLRGVSRLEDSAVLWSTHFFEAASATRRPSGVSRFEDSAAT